MIEVLEDIREELAKLNNMLQQMGKMIEKMLNPIIIKGEIIEKETDEV